MEAASAMSAFLQRIRLLFSGKQASDDTATADNAAESYETQAQRAASMQAQVENLDIPPNDPLLAYLINTASAVEIDKLTLNSPTLERLRQAGVKISVPLVSQGELIGLLNLGNRMSEQEYSTDDRRLLNNLASQAAPALRVAQLAYQQQLQARERERLEQELRVARFIQQNLLPRELPQMPGWNIAAFWQPAREVSGDFYDFIPMPDGRLGFLVADVTDKGVPASLVMATTRSLLRSNAERHSAPGKVLETTNDLLCPDIPEKMFVTCLYGVLDPQTGEIVLANAGHNLPYQHTKDGMIERRARGMPLGLMPGMVYSEITIQMEPGDTLLLTSDGLIEAHNAQREMFGFDRVKALVAGHKDGDMVQAILQAFQAFTGADYVQEDDMTLVTLSFNPTQPGSGAQQSTFFEIPSQPGNERQAAAQVLAALEHLNLDATRQKRLETAVAEATMNAMEHGNGYNPDLLARITILQEGDRLVIRVADQGSGAPIPTGIDPDLDAKLAGLQSPRGWGLFLIKNMVDELNTYHDQNGSTIELVVNL
jgi:serine phosphatase RsbU (regulator of sigma subunit)/anti-sigma regulatory factor (Ser/Thr protein kinase)